MLAFGFFLLSAALILVKSAGKETSAQVEEGITLPIIMYHSVLQDKKYQGKYVITPDEFECDVKYLSEHGYTPVFMSEVIAYTNGKGELPDRPVILSFDDGYYNNYLYILPILEKYHVKIIVAPIGYYTDQYSERDANHANYSHITWDQMKEMVDSGLVEIQNHSYDLHDSSGKRLGASKLSGETDEAYKKLLTDDLLLAQSKIYEHTGIKPTTMVFPFGAISKGSVNIVKELGFSAVFTCEEKMNVITRDPDCLFFLGRYLRPGGKTSEAYFTKNVKLS